MFHPQPRAHHVLAALAAILVSKECVKVDRVIAADQDLYFHVEHHVKNVREGGHQLVRLTRHLDTLVSRQGRTVRVNLDITKGSNNDRINILYLGVGAGVLSDHLDLRPALPDDAAHDALID